MSHLAPTTHQTPVAGMPMQEAQCWLATQARLVLCSLEASWSAPGRSAAEETILLCVATAGLSAVMSPSQAPAAGLAVCLASSGLADSVNIAAGGNGGNEQEHVSVRGGVETWCGEGAPAGSSSSLIRSITACSSGRRWSAFLPHMLISMGDR